MSDSPSPTLLPEIILLIVPLLGQSDLAQCARINKTWHDCCTPLLWKVVQIFRRKHADCLDSPEGLASLVRNAHYTRTFETSCASVAKSFAIRASPPCTNLESLRYQIRGEQSIQFRLEAQRVPVDPLGYSQVLCRLLSQNPGLRSLILGGEWLMNAWDVEDVYGVLNSIPTAELERLEIAFDTPWNERSRIPTAFVGGFDEQDMDPFVALKELVIADCFGGQVADPRFEKWCIKRCASLESIRLKNCGILSLESLARSVFVSCPKLNRLDYISSGEEDDLTFMAVLMMSSEGWKEVQLCGMLNMGPMATRLLMSHASTLEALKCDGWGGEDSTELYPFLCNARRLCRLEGVQDGSGLTYIRELFLNAYMAAMVVNDPWALGDSMEYFQMRIESVPRPDVVCRRNGSPLDDESDGTLPTNMTKRYDVQRFIYTQLSRMTGLRELNLGVPDTVSARHSWHVVEIGELGPFDDPGHNFVREFNYRSLEFSLASGLDLLAGMKELAVLDVRWTAHRIGVEELEWMHANWPKLIKIKGLLSRREWAGDDEGSMTVRAAVDEWIAAHPHGIEVITLIASHLNQHDLAQCLRLSHKWSVFFTQLLWQNVHVDARFHNSIWLGYLLLNKHRIRDLQLSDPQGAHLLALSQRGEGSLRSLSASFQDEATSFLARMDTPRPWTIADYLSEQAANFGNTRALELILTRNWNLRSLTMDESCFRNMDGGDAFSTIMAICPITRLERLELRFGHNPNRPDPPANAQQGPDSFVMADIAAALGDRRELGGLFGFFDVLKELVISGGHCHIDYHRLGFLLRCPNLKWIRLEDIDAIAVASLSVAMGLSCPKLSHLDWKGPPVGQDRDIAILLSASSSGWKEISLPALKNFGTQSFASLMRRVSTTLEVLKVGDWGHTEEDDFLELLCSARNLRRIQGLEDGEFSGLQKEFIVSAYGALYGYTHVKKADQSWALGSSMDFLQLRIVEVPRPDVVYYRFGDSMVHPEDLPEDSGDSLRFKVQRWIYTQLGRLTGLQELVLGVMDLNPEELSKRGFSKDTDPNSIELEEALYHVYPTFNYHTLEFSLESGLELLAGLKKLKVLDVRLTAHRIGVEELDWMHVNWPRLKTIRGLGSKREWAGKAEPRLEVKAAVDAWMAAHPDGIGCYYSETK
ncbi:hypothetical protein EC957_008508 [Mortierella hygrophila]|uniref:F-box domain-containing protein n=1 Tax=Mortierella hygrophila TaxID=979708 RepID=A0A9P6JXW6_9FUNG|nr:hypothetical protein EC957_008508 [Mortierella hygrophila]